MTAEQKPLPEWMRDAIAAEPPGFMRDVVADAFKGISKSASMIPDRMRSEDKPRAPSGGTMPIQSPPGLRWIDQQLDAADRADRMAAAKVKVETDLFEFQLGQAKPRIESEYDPFSANNMKK